MTATQREFLSAYIKCEIVAAIKTVESAIESGCTAAFIPLPSSNLVAEAIVGYFASQGYKQRTQGSQLILTDLKRFLPFPSTNGHIL